MKPRLGHGSIQTRVTPQLAQRIRQLCKERAADGRRSTMSDVVREAVVSFARIVTATPRNGKTLPDVMDEVAPDVSGGDETLTKLIHTRLTRSCKASLASIGRELADGGRNVTRSDLVRRALLLELSTMETG